MKVLSLSFARKKVVFMVHRHLFVCEKRRDVQLTTLKKLSGHIKPRISFNPLFSKVFLGQPKPTKKRPFGEKLQKS